MAAGLAAAAMAFAPPSHAPAGTGVGTHPSSSPATTHAAGLEGSALEAVAADGGSAGVSCEEEGAEEEAHGKAEGRGDDGAADGSAALKRAASAPPFAGREAAVARAADNGGKQTRMRRALRSLVFVANIAATLAVGAAGAQLAIIRPFRTQLAILQALEESE